MGSLRGGMPEEVAVAIETSSRAGSVALRCGDRLLETRLESSKAHARDLLPALETMRAEVALDRGGPFPCEAVFVGLGPGSYTGLRVGIATALGLVRGSGARLLGVPSGEALAWAELSAGEEGAVLLDARSREFYFARYRREEEEVVVLESPMLLKAEELAERLGDERRIFADASVPAAAGLPREIAERICFDAVPRASALLELGSRRLATSAGSSVEEVEPLYLRPFKTSTRRRGT
jgi:tRNA threonylcarbamoyladenosine biosynthesis protein TsaB